ncbi:MAG: EAL and HDOD domain-containing protein [Solirubrobacteraceae bacterium]
MTDMRIARQPILNQQRVVEGYELLYPTGAVDETLAAIRITLDALSEIGLERMVGATRAWISVTPEFLTSDMVLNLPPDRTVLEVSLDADQDDAHLARIAELRSAGYSFAAEHFRLTSPTTPLLDLVNMIKIDMRALGARELARHAFELREREVELVACEVQTGEEFTLARAAGANLFQGFFFCRPYMLPGRRITPSRAALLALASALQDPDIQLDGLERIIRSDVALSYRLLKYINSAYFSLRREITSIKHALALLGIEPLRRWATLSTFAEVGDQPRELLVTALVRARFCETAGSASDGTPAELFTLGLFSVLDALTGTPMYTALADLPLAPNLQEALLRHTGAGRLLDCVIAIEEGDFERANEIRADSAACYVDAVAWSNDSGARLLA